MIAFDVDCFFRILVGDGIVKQSDVTDLMNNVRRLVKNDDEPCSNNIMASFPHNNSSKRVTIIRRSNKWFIRQDDEFLIVWHIRSKLPYDKFFTCQTNVS